MPTNVLRKVNPKPAAGTSAAAVSGAPRLVRLSAGRVSLKLELLATATADLLWRAMPIFSNCETWGESIHFECPIRAGRERTARLNVAPGDVCYWAEDCRVMLGWGPTPISRPNEIRLMRPCNIWARAIDDPALLAAVTPGEKVSLGRL